MPAGTDLLAEQALSTARALLDPHTVTAALPPSAAHTLSDGLAGTALLHACLARHDPQFATAAAAHWQATRHHLRGAPPDGIYTGPGALAASLIIGTGYLPDPEPYQTTVRKATTWLSARAQGLASHQHQRFSNNRPGAPWAVYDTIKGLAGIGRVLLAAHTTGHHTEAEPGLTAALTTLTTLITTSPGTRPGWWLPAADHPPGVTVHHSGAATTGLAHGIAGPLAVLSIAHSHGYTVPGQTHAIRTAATWLTTWQEPTGTWPPFISGNDLDSPLPPHRPRPPQRRDAWCYGTPGIGRALCLGGQALTDAAVIRAGQTAITAMADRSPLRWDTEGPTLCHGTAGVLQAAERAQSRSVAERAAHATADFHDPQCPFGFPHIEARTSYDNPGFLTGAAGAALATASHAALITARPTAPWDSLLMLC
ncbi:lanthionine synthetase C family protein [Streptomyces aidingensis]|uniref:Lanthionine synthetase C-like protein n=1 Tax=Streptomyces aidingensis TaxID=910347 RepID=A0A1I1TSL6_9ACTN|nr:lanthionine synthetase C family protein [Streptomyces aidingensis]SFD61641.1 Lanthionine synthetase C-like protein [Streptomyces aidingensis]